MVVTKHAKSRLKARQGINNNKAYKLADRALNHGIDHKKITGDLKKWISRKAHNNASNIENYHIRFYRLYGGHAYVFDKDTITKYIKLVTVLNIPYDLWLNIQEYTDGDTYKKYKSFMKSKRRYK